MEDEGYITRGLKKGNFKEENYEKKESRFGLIVFESNSDLELKDVYSAYKGHWEVETLFNDYKNIIERQKVNGAGNYRLFAVEFINFLSSIMSMRIKRHPEKASTADMYSQKQVMYLLSKYAKKRGVKKPNPWVDYVRLKYIIQLCDLLGV